MARHGRARAAAGSADFQGLHVRTRVSTLAGRGIVGRRGAIAVERSEAGRLRGSHDLVVCPLACCGSDAPSNMQWQTRAEAKAKDAWELDCSSCPR